jgi:hypothetical protein
LFVSLKAQAEKLRQAPALEAPCGKPPKGRTILYDGKASARKKVIVLVQNQLPSLVIVSKTPPLLSSTMAAGAFNKRRRHAATAEISLVAHQPYACSRLTTSPGQPPELAAG